MLQNSKLKKFQEAFYPYRINGPHTKSYIIFHGRNIRKLTEHVSVCTKEDAKVSKATKQDMEHWVLLEALLSPLLYRIGMPEGYPLTVLAHQFLLQFLSFYHIEEYLMMTNFD